MTRWQLDAYRFDAGQWWWQPTRTRLTSTLPGAWWLRRRLDHGVQWRIQRVPTMRGRS